MYKKILVAVDGSGTSNAALGEALELARVQQARLRLLHVVDSPYAYPDVMYGHVAGDHLRNITDCGRGLAFRHPVRSRYSHSGRTAQMACPPKVGGQSCRQLPHC